MMTYGMGGQSCSSSKVIDIKWVLKVKKIKFSTVCKVKK
jgi:hypothetical protein